MHEQPTVIDVLRRARDRIATPDKWYQGDFRSPEGSNATCAVCAWGAIRWAVHGNPAPLVLPTPKNVQLVDRALDVVLRVIDQPALVAWNDAPGRTHDEVLAAFDKAIALAEEHPDA